jgi:hypothetical protein
MIKFNICPNKQLALVNIYLIEGNLRRLGVLRESDNFGSPIQVMSGVGEGLTKYGHVLPTQDLLDRWGLRYDQVMENVVVYFETTENPAYMVPDQYEIYNWLNETAADIFQDNTIIPHGIDYVKDVTPRLHRFYTYGPGGLLESTKFSIWDFDNDVEIAPVLMVTEQYELIPGPPYPAAQAVLKRTKQRQWYRSDGTLREDKTDVKNTVKLYDDINLIRKEQKRRRENAINNMSQGVVTQLTILKYLAEAGGDVVEAQGLAENWLIGILASVNAEFTTYQKSGRVLAETVEAMTDSNLDIAIPPQGAVPQLDADPYASRGAGMTVKEYMVKSIKGEI